MRSARRPLKRRSEAGPGRRKGKLRAKCGKKMAFRPVARANATLGYSAAEQSKCVGKNKKALTAEDAEDAEECKNNT